MTRTRGFVLLLAALALAGASPAAAQSPDPKALAELLMQRERDFAAALAERDSAKVLAFVADEIVSFGPGPAIGRQEFEKRWASFLDPKGSATLSWWPAKAEVYPTGDLGYTTGPWEARGKKADGTPRVSHGHYLSVWRKQADGVWRVALDIGTDGAPGAAARP